MSPRSWVLSRNGAQLPTLAWLGSSDLALNSICAAGAVFSVLLIANILPRRQPASPSALYLSLVNTDSVFLTFQWDHISWTAAMRGKEKRAVHRTE